MVINHLLTGMILQVGGTPQKTTMYPENEWIEHVFPIQIVPF